MKQSFTAKRDKGINALFITLFPFSQTAGGKGDKGINTYRFIPYPPTGARGVS